VRGWEAVCHHTHAQHIPAGTPEHVPRPAPIRCSRIPIQTLIRRQQQNDLHDKQNAGCRWAHKIRKRTRSDERSTGMLRHVLCTATTLAASGFSASVFSRAPTPASNTRTAPFGPTILASANGMEVQGFPVHTNARVSESTSHTCCDMQNRSASPGNYVWRTIVRTNNHSKVSRLENLLEKPYRVWQRLAVHTENSAARTVAGIIRNTPVASDRPLQLSSTVACSTLWRRRFWNWLQFHP